MSDRHPIEIIAQAGAPAFITADARQLLAQAIGAYEDATGRTLAPSQVETYILEVIAYMLSVRGAEEQLGLEQNLLAYARGDRLDAIGADRYTARIEASFGTAVATLSGSGPFTSNRFVPKGTRVGFAGVTFAVAENTLVAAGVASVAVTLTALEPGPLPQVLEAGIAGVLIDPVPELTTATLAGNATDGALREGDDQYRVRIAQAWERISRGGSRLGYEAIVRTWDARVLDVHISRPQPGYARIVPLLEGAVPIGAQDQQILLNFLEGRIPQGDYPSVEAPVPDTFDVDLSLVVTFPEAVPAAEEAVEALLTDWKARLGGAVVPSDIIAAARSVEGVVEADVPGLVYRVIAPDAYRNGSLSGPAVVTVMP